MDDEDFLGQVIGISLKKKNIPVKKKKKKKKR
jgi:hypothetical protein